MFLVLINWIEEDCAQFFFNKFHPMIDTDINVDINIDIDIR
jgi:hypothetical protein